MKIYVRSRAVAVAAALCALVVLSYRFAPETSAQSYGYGAAEAHGGEKITVQSKSVGERYVLAQPRVGPYKRLAPVFAEVARFAHGRGVSGTPVGIYYDDSRRVPPDVQKSDIGLLISEPVELDAKRDKPFEVKTLAPRQVAYARVKRPFGEVPRAYKAIAEWAWKNGYRISHPIVEIYDRVPVEDDEDLVTEIQVTIEKADLSGR